MFNCVALNFLDCSHLLMFSMDESGGYQLNHFVNLAESYTI
jgi:hypothetical protein